MHSLQGVRPAAPQTSVQTSHVHVELSQTEVIDPPLIETTVAAGHRRKSVGCRERKKERKWMIERKKLGLGNLTTYYELIRWN